MPPLLLLQDIALTFGVAPLLSGAGLAVATDDRVCRGTLLSRSQYLVDLERWGFEDARLEPRGSMSKQEIDRWTAAIELDGSR